MIKMIHVEKKFSWLLRHQRAHSSL